AKVRSELTLEIRAGSFHTVRLAGARRLVVAGNPNCASGCGGRPTKLMCLLTQEHLKAFQCSHEGGGHACGAGAEDEHISFPVPIHPLCLSSGCCGSRGMCYC